MSTGWVTEYATLDQDGQGQFMPVASCPPLAVQTVTFSTATSLANNFNPSTRYIRIYADANFHASFDGTAATTSDEPFTSRQGEYRQLRADVVNVSLIDAA